MAGGKPSMLDAVLKQMKADNRVSEASLMAIYRLQVYPVSRASSSAGSRDSLHDAGLEIVHWSQ